MAGSPKRHTGPSPADQQLFKLWDTIEAERSQRGERAALALANKALKAIEPAQPVEGIEPVVQKGIRGMQVEQRPAAKPTALSEIDRLASERAIATKRTTEQCYAEVLSERPELYDRYNQELAEGVYVTPVATATTTERRSKPVEGLVMGTAEGYVAAGDETNIVDALQRVFRESPAAYAAWLEESRGA